MILVYTNPPEYELGKLMLQRNVGELKTTMNGYCIGK